MTKNTRTFCVLLEKAWNDKQNGCYNPDLARELEKIDSKSHLVDELYGIANDECIHQNVMSKAAKKYHCFKIVNSMGKEV